MDTATMSVEILKPRNVLKFFVTNNKITILVHSVTKIYFKFLILNENLFSCGALRDLVPFLQFKKL